MLSNLAQPQKAMGMATYLISRRMFAITLMTTLALTAVARPMLAADPAEIESFVAPMHRCR